MAVRSHDERVAELQEKREKTKKKLEQYDEQIKRLEKIAAEEARKKRTHALIVCGAEIAALFDNVLDQDEIYTVVNFLREQRELGTFSLVKREITEMEETGKEIEKPRTDGTVLYGGMFDF